MKELIRNKDIVTLTFGILFIGGAAAILGIVRAANNTRRPPEHVMEEYDADIFI